MFILSILLPRISPENTLYLAGGFSLLGLIVATIVLIPLITDIMSIVFEFVYKNILGNEGKLAARNMKITKYNTEYHFTIYKYFCSYCNKCCW